MSKDLLIRDMEYLLRKQNELKLTDDQMLEWVLGRRCFKILCDNCKNGNHINCLLTECECE